MNVYVYLDAIERHLNYTWFCSSIQNFSDTNIQRTYKIFRKGGQSHELGEIVLRVTDDNRLQRFEKMSTNDDNLINQFQPFMNIERVETMLKLEKL